MTNCLRRISPSWYRAVSVGCSLVACIHTGLAEPDGGPSPTTPMLSPREAGARYGQALGAVEVCFGAKVTAKAAGLTNSYAGADQAAFKAEAAKILNAWVKVKGCVDQADPNRCKIIMDKSCLAAEAEIGPEGRALQGLVDFAKQ
jgi:hypothetical protein